MSSRYLVPVALVAVCLISTTLKADVITQKRTKRVVEFEAKFIHGLAYPTVTHSEFEYDGTRAFSDGSFDHFFTFRGKWEDQRGYFSMRFRYDSRGRLLSVDDTARSWLFEPFTTSTLLVEVIKEAMKGMLDDPNVSAQTKANLRKFIKNGQVDSFMVAYLNAKNGF